MCDARYNFILVDVGQFGSNNDSGVLANSSMGRRFENGTIGLPDPEYKRGYTNGLLPYYLVGDEIFALKPWMMRPYPGKLAEEERVFNYRLSRSRRVIENVFGILRARWRIFSRPIKASIENTERYIMAAVCLHNYLRQTENALYFKVRNFRCQKLSRFRVFWPFPRKLIPRNVSKYFIRESLFPRNFSLFSNFSYFSFFESFSGDIYLETLITQLFDTFH